MNNDLIIRNWNIRNYHCALCGNNKSVKYWLTTKDANTISICNKCYLKAKFEVSKND